MSNDKFKVKKGIKLETNSTASDADGEIRFDGTNLKIFSTTEKTLVDSSTVSGTNTGDVTLAAVGSSPNANGATLTSQALNLQPADATNPGVMTTGAQTFAGAKTFNSTIVGSINGNAATVTTNANLSGDVSSSGNVTTIGATKVTNAMLAGSIDVTTKLNGAVPIANGGTNNASLDVTAGGTVYTDGSKVVNVGAGTSGQVLQSNGSSAPSWVTAASGGKNYITNNEATTDTTGWATYADAAASSPVDGTGGAPASTFARNTTTPLRGAADFLWTHSAANRQGEGFSYDFTIDVADKGKVLQGTFDYKIASGTYADDDLQIWIYDVTNAVLIQPAPYKIKNHSLASERMPFEFQTSSSSVSYRLIVHVATATATAYTIQLDAVSIGPNAKLYGSPVTDLVAYTPTVVGFTSGPTITKSLWARRGDMMLIYGTLTLTDTSNASISVSLPSGYTIDTAKAAAVAATGNLGQVTAFDQSGNLYSGTVVYGTTTTLTFTGPNTSSRWASTVPFTWASTDTMSYIAEVPILGWSSSVIMSQDAATNVVAARAQGTTAATYTSGATTIVPYNTVAYDTNGAMGTTGTYTVPVSGYYRVTASIVVGGGTLAAGGEILLDAYVTGVEKARIASFTNITAGSITSTIRLNGACTVQCVAGDAITVRFTETATGTLTFNNNITRDFFQVERISGPAQIASSETINFSTNSSSTTITSSAATVVYSSVDFDSHSAYSSGVFTAPASGVYLFSAGILNNGTHALDSAVGIEFYKNNTTTVRRTITRSGGIETNLAVTITARIRLLAGETIRVRVDSTATTPTIATSATFNWFDGGRVGNY